MKNIDSLKIHTLTTQVNHDDYMAYRAAVKGAKLSSAAFLRCLITVGLGEVTPIVTKSSQKAKLQKQLKAIQAQMDALNNIAPPQPKNITLTPTGRFAKGERTAMLQVLFRSNPNADTNDVRAYLSKLKGVEIPLSTASNALHKYRTFVSVGK